jgi:hypothetical protein
LSCARCHGESRGSVRRSALELVPDGRETRGCPDVCTHALQGTDLYIYKVRDAKFNDKPISMKFNRTQQLIHSRDTY